MTVEDHHNHGHLRLFSNQIEGTLQMKGVDVEWAPQPRFEFGVAFS